jgi:hypothetical protein
LALPRNPSSSKTLLVRRMIQDKPNFASISGDDLRTMVFNEPISSSGGELLYSLLALIRDELLGLQYNIMIDTSAPTNGTRSYLMGTN